MISDPQLSKKHSAFKQGLLLGFSSPVLYLGELPPYRAPEGGSIERAWLNVGRSIRNAMKVEGARLRDDEN